MFVDKIKIIKRALLLPPHYNFHCHFWKSVKRKEKMSNFRSSLGCGITQKWENIYNSNKKEQWKFFCNFPKRSTETSACYITSKVLALLSSVFSLSSLANFRLDFYSLRFDAFSTQRNWSGWDQVISSSLISDPTVLAPISGASPWFSQSHLMLKFCGVWWVVTVFYYSDFWTRLF